MFGVGEVQIEKTLHKDYYLASQGLQNEPD